MTLWDAYRLANRRRARVRVERLDGAARGMLTVHTSLNNGYVEWTEGTTSDPHWATAEQAKAIEVERV